MQKPIKLVLLAFVFLTMLVSGCASAPTPTPIPPTRTPSPTPPALWPSDTGYVTPATRKPSAPYQIQTDKTDWEIYGGDSDNGYSGNGDVEYKDSKSLAFGIGAIITNRTTSQTSLTLKDYNEDECVIPYGMTVRVDEYGQYIPVKYDPNLLPPP